MSTTPNTTSPATSNNLIPSATLEYNDDERVVVEFEDGSWYTNYGRSCEIYKDGLTERRAQAVALDDGTISYIKALARQGSGGNVCDDVRKGMIGIIIDTCRNNIRRKELERILVEEVAAKEIVSRARRDLTALMPSSPEVNQTINAAVRSLAYSIDMIHNRIDTLNEEIAALI